MPSESYAGPSLNNAQSLQANYAEMDDLIKQLPRTLDKKREEGSVNLCLLYLDNNKPFQLRKIADHQDSTIEKLYSSMKAVFGEESETIGWLSTL